jgi:formylglycine-generating enzyme required for sulfatase activity
MAPRHHGRGASTDLRSITDSVANPGCEPQCGRSEVFVGLRSNLQRVLGPAALLCALVGTVDLPDADATGDEPKARSSASLSKQVKQLKKQVAALQAQVDAISRQPGPPGPPGSPPACEGNDASDVMVEAGAVCIDKYEVSVWSSPTGGTQYGATTDDYPCDDEGQNCDNIYARSVAGVTPSRYITYFQAQQALANVGKRLPTSAEWQQAVAGTPDSAACDITGDISSTGANAGCTSNWGATDMVGNLFELTADWLAETTTCLNWDPLGTFSSDDSMCLAGADTTNDAGDAAGTLLRGGGAGSGASAGPFAVQGAATSESFALYGFRGVR